MSHPVVHALAILAAILIPGAEVLYFAWAIRAKHKEKQEEAAKGDDPIEEIREAFRDMFPKDSLRAKERRKRLALLQRRRRRKFPK
jgi:hypothetical protein